MIYISVQNISEWYNMELFAHVFKHGIIYNCSTSLLLFFGHSTLFLSMDCSTPGFPVYHQLLELIQTHVHQVGDAIQPSHFTAAAAAAKSLQSCPTLCDPTDGSPLSSPVLGILQARTLEWVAISFSSGWKWKVKVKSLSRVRLSDPMDCSLPGSSIHGIFPARVLEWGAIAFSSVTASNA